MIEDVVSALKEKLPDAKVSVEGGILIVDRAWLTQVATFLRDEKSFDYLANLCASDFLTPEPGYLEVVYHLYSTITRGGQLAMKCRTANRSDDTKIPSVTPIWRAAEYQEREAYDLYGVIFEGHPDLRRILMWDELVGFPMRKDYVPPDDYEWEPTPHDHVVERVKARVAKTKGAAS